MPMKNLARDLRDEGAELKQLLLTLSNDDWSRASPFKRWSPEDVIGHLMVGDWFNTLAISDPDRFDEVMAARTAARAAGAQTSGLEYLDEAVGSGAELVPQWYERFCRLCDIFHAADAKARMKWVGPDMSIRSAATARLMETWAHGQDIYDMLRVERQASDRIRHIAVLGMNTFAWTFINRGLEPPKPIPCVELQAPSGATWSWNESENDNRISGSALDFCHVVTQGRNIEDTALRVSGPIATRWMSIAQCFAGPPEDPPVPGLRAW